MDSLAQIILAAFLGVAAMMFASGWAEGQKCVVSKADADAGISQDVDYSKYDW